MLGASIFFSQKIIASNPIKPDVILTTDMMDVSLFKSLLPKNWFDIPILLYFHENQFAYPWSHHDRDEDKEALAQRYQFINYSSALCADRVFFNSHFNYTSFLKGSEKMLRQRPDVKLLDTIDQLIEKSAILPLGICLPSPNNFNNKRPPTIIWNHRWDYDKAPDDFFSILKSLKKNQLIFKLIILGKKNHTHPHVFDEAQKVFHNDIIHYGPAESNEEYWSYMRKADIALTTSYQDFFGVSVIEGIWSGAIPILPKRLAYPEHIPDGLHYPYFFHSLNQAVDLIQKHANDFDPDKQKQDHEKMINKIGHYQWDRLISTYDEQFLLSS